MINTFSDSKDYIQLQGGMSKTFGYERVKDIATETINSNKLSEQEFQQTQTPYKKKHTIAVTMRLERFFSTVIENTSKLSAAAKQMLASEEYINFFMTCGPNYIRTIHRAHELLAVFNFEESDPVIAQLFTDSLKAYVYGNRRNATDVTVDEDGNINVIGFDFDDVLLESEAVNSLTIEILAYGLGDLITGGSETLVTTSLDEFNRVMRFAFDSMVKTNNDNTDDDDDDDTGNDNDLDLLPAGLIHGIEVVPWADNVEFIQVGKVFQETVTLPQPYGMIENSETLISNEGETVVLCLSDASIADDYGKCCDPLEIVDVTMKYGDSYEEVKRSCQPRAAIPPALMRANLQVNAEFVSWLGSLTRDKAHRLTTLTQCVNKLHSIPKHLDYYFLEISNKVGFEEALEMSLTVKELKAALDPSIRGAIISMVGQEHDEYLEMFYQPCVSALYGMNTGTDTQIEPLHFMAEPWYNHEECSRQSCMIPTSAWDRINGNGCIDGLLSQTVNSDVVVNDQFDPYCAKVIDDVTGREVCKYTYLHNSNRNVQIMDRLQQCRGYLPQSTDGRGMPVTISLASLMDYYCFPKVDEDREPADETLMDKIDEMWSACMLRR